MTGIASLFLGWVPILGHVLVAVSLVTGIVALIADLLLAVNGEGSVMTVILDVAALDSFGIGRALASSAKEFAAFLKDYNPTLVKQLQRAPKQLKTTEGLVTEWGAILPGFFDAVTPFLQLLNAYDPHLRTTLASYAAGINALGDVLHGGKLNLALIADKDARCSYGTSALDPRSTSRRELQKNGQCSASFAQLQRGAAHAPGPVSTP